MKISRYLLSIIIIIGGILFVTKVMGTNIQPSMTIITPFAPGGEADESYIISWDDSDPDNNAKIALYFNKDNTGTFNATLIVKNIDEDENTNIYLWNTSDISEGNYYIYGIIDDGINPPVCTYASGKLFIRHWQRGESKLPWYDKGVWLMGDIHVHTVMSEGDYPETEIVKKAKFFGCDFIAITPHGEAEIGTLSYYQAIKNARFTCPDIVIFDGMEWNIPAGEHATILVTNVPNEHEIIKKFRLNYDSLVSGKTELNDAIEGLRWLNSQRANGVLPICSLNHPSRIGLYTIEELRAYDKVGDVFIGFAGAPGYQKIHIPGYDLIDGYDPMVGEIGGTWDILLSEERNFWIRVESDFHNPFFNYYPGEYSKTYVFCPTKSYEGVIKGLRRGCMYCVHGDIITDLEFTVSSEMMSGVMMGEVLQIKNRDPVVVSIKVRFNEEITKIELISNISGKPKLTKVFTSKDWIEKDGYLIMNYKITNFDNDFYVRIRGKSSTDKWFYSNPIKIKVTI
ncbi:MAG: PHP domain-containing protein [bacterium]